MEKKQKLIYWFIGLGCGVMLSGLVIIFIGLNIKPSIEKTLVSTNTQVAPVFQSHVINSNSVAVKNSEKTLNLTQSKSTNPVEKATLDEQEQSNYKWVDIPHTYNANQISKFLEQEGIVESAVDFSEYIKEQKMTRKLLTGKQHLPIKGEYALLLELLKVDYKN